MEGIYFKHQFMSEKKKKIRPPQNLGAEEISLFIKNWRINEGLTQNDFGKLADVHTNSVYNLEHQKNVTLSTLLRCIDATGLSLSEFFEGME
jgi:transcriptional regulator with XRE-family HTH domain